MNNDFYYLDVVPIRILDYLSVIEHVETTQIRFGFAIVCGTHARGSNKLRTKLRPVQFLDDIYIFQRYLSSTGEIAGRNSVVMKDTYMYAIKRLITNHKKRFSGILFAIY